MAIFHKGLKYHEDTTEKRKLNQEDIEFLKKLQLEMNTQDTVSTADPRFWVIKGSERVYNVNYPDEWVLQIDGSFATNTTEETLEYLNKNILSQGDITGKRDCTIKENIMYDFEITYSEDGKEEREGFSVDEANEFLDDSGFDDVRIVGMQIRPITYPNTMFLTEKAAREHLEKNDYHYSDDAHTYCMHAWRSPDVKRLWKILRETEWDHKGRE